MNADALLPGADPAGDYERVGRAIEFLRQNYLAQPSLEEIARSVHLSPFHFQRLFTRWAGVSPKRFVQFLTVEHAKSRLARSRDVLGAALDAGLSGPGRLHDLFVQAEAMSPGEFKRLGADLEIRHAIGATPFGWAFIAVTPRGVCELSFWDGATEARAALGGLRGRWPAARLIADDDAGAGWLARIFRRPGAVAGDAEPIPVLLAGTNFQLKVWRALLEIAPGEMASYGDVAAMVDAPRASRAVGTAVAGNVVAFLIPCHRVIRKTGVIGDYRWGTTRKRALLGWEAARGEAALTG